MGSRAHAHGYMLSPLRACEKLQLDLATVQKSMVKVYVFQLILKSCHFSYVENRPT